MSASLPSILAIDYGTRKSGLAYSVGSFAFALKTYPTKELASVIPKIIREKNITKIVIGMPYNIDGTLSVHAKRASEFAQEVEKKYDLPVALHDERLTTAGAIMGFAEDGIDGDIDAEAARLILEDYLSTSNK